MGWRSDAVKARAVAVEARLAKLSEASIKKLAYETLLDEHLVRYALRTLADADKCHVSAFIKSESGSHIAIFKYGPGKSVTLSDVLGTQAILDDRLDFASTRHLQPFYVDWTLHREIIDITGEEDA